MDQTTTRDLTSFCSPDKTTTGHCTLTSPWIYNGWQYATDGRICVRQPTLQVAYPPTDDDMKRPAAFHLFSDFPKNCSRPWPKHDGGTVDVNCPTCNGSGREDCNCPTCGTDHSRPCLDCAYGKVPVPKVQTIAGRKIAGTYCLKIQALGDVLYGPDDDWDEPLAFASGDLQGLINGMTL